MAKHEKTFVDFDKAYETNLIGLRGVIYFGIGLFLLIVVTFGLMFFLQQVMEEQVAESDLKQPNPMTMDGVERLPPEPRLQGAPGFGVQSPQGFINLELQTPQAEYRELQRQWEKTWAEGQKDAMTGTVITLPIEEAKKRLLAENVKAATGVDAQKTADESQSIVSYSSAGRLASDKRK
ncbi:MAG: hypothetical protein M3Q78_11895 [Acidobacteriota bacterium]|jgi:hypothetical protein|nr:hypothetical protein [Acidobacteriota bacterium]